MKRKKLTHSLIQIPLLALLSITVACSTDDEPVVLRKHTGQTQDSIYPKQEEAEAYKSVEQMPVFKGGDEEMFRFLGENVRYPEEAKEAGIEGLVVFSFIVEKDGSISSIKTVKSLSPETDAEALRVIKMTDKKWKPGLLGGEPVRAEYTLPMRFAMK